MKKGKDGFYNLYIKRILDLVLALILSVPALIIIAICCVVIRAESKGPAFFVQERPGYKGRIFKIYKLRTMRIETERDGRPLSDMERMTKSGRIIRKLSLDELPQILNILKGEMSFIGNRPLLVEYLELYSPEQMRRHDVRPGISGWAQVNGRNALTWEQKFEKDVFYVDNVCFGLDMKILFMTVRDVLLHRGINAGANIGRGVIINTCSSVDHDCVIGDFCHIAVGAHLAGTAAVGAQTLIGAGAAVINNLTVAADVTVGAGAAVIGHITETGTYVGVPARKVN